jgi:Tol biopolymer transport system component
MFPPPMTVFTIKQDGTNLKQRTFNQDMNWAPYPAPDGRHYVFVKVVDGKNWEVFLGDLAGGAPMRLTWRDGFDGLPSLSPNGKKMVFARAEPNHGGTWLYVMDVSSLNLGPENYKGIIDTPQGG